MKLGKRWVILAGALASIVVLAAQAGEPQEPPAEPTPVHADTAKLETAFLETVRAFVHEDNEAAGQRLAEIEKLSRRLVAADEERYGADVVNYDLAFHMTIDRTRELARRGRGDEAFNQFVYIQRACVNCHRLLATRGE